MKRIRSQSKIETPTRVFSELKTVEKLDRKMMGKAQGGFFTTPHPVYIGKSAVDTN